MANKRPPRYLTVFSKRLLTPNMIRVTLTGEGLADFPANSEGTYIKLDFTAYKAAGGKPAPGGAQQGEQVLRTYTVAAQRPGPDGKACENQIDVDFMVHGKSTNGESPNGESPNGESPNGESPNGESPNGQNPAEHSGPAISWAKNCKPGDPLCIFGPGNARFISLGADRYLLAADMTALPALKANLKRLPPDAAGYVVVEVLSKADQQALRVPKGMEVIWVINPDPGSAATPLHTACESLKRLDGTAATWCACEFKTMQKMRLLFKNGYGVPRQRLYVSSYWKHGLSEPGHKTVKRLDEVREAANV